MSEIETREVTKVSALLVGGKPGKDDVHLKRDVLLAQLFPTEVARPKLGRYDLLQFLGEGGMGTVYAAYDPRLDRRVAVKVLRGTRGQQEHLRIRMLREAKALARLSHPHIVTVHEVWEERGEIFLAMEFVQGETLAQWQPLRPMGDVIGAYRQAGEGLAAAHEAGLVYRDFKPHNVIRREDGVVKLLDFGLARIDDVPELVEPTGQPTDDRFDSDAYLTRPGTIMGTPAYMSPEQHRGEPADARSDQFGFCLALWEGLYGELPFVREPGPPVELRRRAEPIDRDVPSWVRRILERGIALEPDQRYPSMRALLRELGRDPAAKRRRVLGAVAVAAATVIGGLVVAELRAEPTRSCVLLDGPWDEPRRDAAYQGVVGAGGATGEQTWALLSPRLQRYASELTDLREQTCEAHLRGLRSDAHYDLQVACLDRREAGFEGLVELLARGDAAAVTNANKVIAELPTPGGCTDTQALLAEQPPPDDPLVEAELGGLREELARAEVDEAAGLYESAEARAAAVLQRADALGYAPLRAEALLRWGSAGMQARRRGEASGRLDQALWLALATEQRRVAAEAAAKRIFTRVELDDHTTDVKEAIELARSLSNRSGAADWRIRWLVANNVGVVLDRQGERSGALASYEAALAAIPQEGNEQGAFERAATSFNMAPVQVRQGRPADGERSVRTAIDALEQLLGEAHPTVLLARVTLAQVVADNGRLEEARRIFDQVIAHYVDDEPSLSMLLDGAWIAWRQGDRDAVRTWCRRAQPQLRAVSGSGEVAPTQWTLAFDAMEARVAAVEGDPSGLERLHALAPKVPAALRTKATLDRAEVALLLERTAEAGALVTPLMEDPKLSETERTRAQELLARAWASPSAQQGATSIR